MNSLGRAQQVFLFLLLALIACDDDSYLLGFQSPDENFKVVYAEFTLPTTSFQADSLLTSNGSDAQSTKRMLVGSLTDDVFGKATASSYMQFFPAAFPIIHDTAVYDKLTLNMYFDMYQTGAAGTTTQTFNFYPVGDSIVNSTNYFTKSTMTVDPTLLASVTKGISPEIFDQAAILNKDNNAKNDLYDSVNVTLDAEYGKAIFAAIRTTDSLAKLKYRNFSRWRKVFKGIAILPGSSDKIVGFAPHHSHSQLILHYREAGVVKQLELNISPTEFLLSFSTININRAGSPLAAITTTYTDFEPADGMRFVQSGGGMLTKIDFQPVYDYFQDIPIKSLNVAELSILTDQQQSPPVTFTLRALKTNNRTMIKTLKVVNEAWDSVSTPDPKFLKHYVSPLSLPRGDVLGDDGQLFVFSQKSNTGGVASYKGYLANFLQREVDLVDKDYLRYFSLIPTSHDFAKSVNGFYFHKDSVKLKIFYTTPIPKE